MIVIMCLRVVCDFVYDSNCMCDSEYMYENDYVYDSGFMERRR